MAWPAWRGSCCMSWLLDLAVAESVKPSQISRDEFPHSPCSTIYCPSSTLIWSRESLDH